jgi:NADH:ubiquinone oxidoreductase subunit 6 (subunit J)
MTLGLIGSECRKTKEGKNMLAAYLLAAMLSGLIGAGIWLVTGGTFLGAFGVYMMTGHLVMAAMFAKSFFQPSDGTETD